jgi:adenine deaminase
LPLVSPENATRICLCTDDREPRSLLDEGSVDHLIRTAIAEGVDPVMAIRMGTLNTAQYFRLRDRGFIAPGKRADMVVFSDLHDLRAEMVFRAGKLAAQDGRMVGDKPPQRPIDLRASLNVKPDSLDFSISAGNGKVRVIGGSDITVVTPEYLEDAKVVDGIAVSDTERDILKMVVVERHRASGNVGKGFIKGFGLKRGAIAGTVAHDHHNMIVIGADDLSMVRAAEALIEMGGGLVTVDGDQVLASLALPVAGLMSEEPLDVVRRDYDAVIAAAQGLGSTMNDPFMAMSFMGLEVIPKLKLTDVGLVDVEQFTVVDLFVG